MKGVALPSESTSRLPKQGPSGLTLTPRRKLSYDVCAPLRASTGPWWHCGKPHRRVAPLSGVSVLGTTTEYGLPELFLGDELERGWQRASRGGEGGRRTHDDEQHGSLLDRRPFAHHYKADVQHVRVLYRDLASACKVATGHGRLLLCFWRGHA